MRGRTDGQDRTIVVGGLEDFVCYFENVLAV